ncbi:MAG: right-handed parallel beta-helix repeat-containing protein [Candidatus Hydrogenedentes bacterium]|nr:right-handed parallel beta-helix repeat-containing protein [Candidatus Hydrogenedentota bacterium]
MPPFARVAFVRLCLLLACSTGLHVAGAIVYVSQAGDGTTGDSWETALPNISDALDQVGAGEKIYVAEGTYAISEPMAVPTDVEILGGFSGSAKGSSGENDPGMYPTILDGEDIAGSAFVCNNVLDVLIDGFTFTGFVGSGDGYGKGGAIRCEADADVQIRDCFFTRNDIDGYGGGVNVINAFALIEDCVFLNNSAQEGGGVKVHSGSLLMRHCIFNSNDAGLIGGGFSGYDSDTRTRDCLFIDNDGPYGGGIECHEGTRAEFENCLFAKNRASVQGGGLTFTFQDGVAVINCTIADNETDGNGGGIFLHDSTGEIINSIFSKNNAHAIFENSTTVDPSVENCLFHANPDGAYFDEGSTSIATASGPGGMNSVLAEAEGNIDGDPLFANPKVDDYHLTTGSPAIDAASKDDAPNHDIDGDSRPIKPSKAGSKFDIGFDEYNPGALLVVDAPGDGDKLKIGKEYKILWHSDGYTGSSVRLELVRGGEVVRAIGDKTPNDGFAKWTVPNDVPARKGYSVRITNVNDPIFSDESEGGFKIVNP